MLQHRRTVALALLGLLGLCAVAVAQPAPDAGSPATSATPAATAAPSAFPVVAVPDSDRPPPDFPRRADGTLDSEALRKELRDRSTTPEAVAAQARRLREESNEPGDRIHPFFGSERVLFNNLTEGQTSWAILYRSVAEARWYLAAMLAGLVLFAVGANWVRWRRLERTYLQDPVGAAAPAEPEAGPEA